MGVGIGRLPSSPVLLFPTTKPPRTYPRHGTGEKQPPLRLGKNRRGEVYGKRRPVVAARRRRQRAPELADEHFHKAGIQAGCGVADHRPAQPDSVGADPQCNLAVPPSEAEHDPSLSGGNLTMVSSR